jgi:hypothetical protein
MLCSASLDLCGALEGSWIWGWCVRVVVMLVARARLYTSVSVHAGMEWRLFYMSRVRLVLLGVLAACALSAAASTPAFAGSCTGSTNWVFCSGAGTELASGTLVLGLGGLSLLASTVGLVEVKIHCPDVHVHGLLLSLGHFHGTLTYLGCRLVKPTTCKLSTANESKIVASFNGELTGGKSATITGSAAGEEFAVVEIVQKSSCAIIANYKITGSQLVSIPKGEESVAEQEIVATKENSHLKFGVEPASYSGSANVMLAAGGTWLNMFGV